MASLLCLSDSDDDGSEASDGRVPLVLDRKSLSPDEEVVDALRERLAEAESARRALELELASNRTTREEARAEADALQGDLAFLVAANRDLREELGRRRGGDADAEHKLAMAGVASAERDAAHALAVQQLEAERDELKAELALAHGRLDAERERAGARHDALKERLKAFAASERRALASVRGFVEELVREHGSATELAVAAARAEDAKKADALAAAAACKAAADDARARVHAAELAILRRKLDESNAEAQEHLTELVEAKLCLAQQATLDADYERYTRSRGEAAPVPPIEPRPPYESYEERRADSPSYREARAKTALREVLPEFKRNGVPLTPSARAELLKQLDT